MSLNWTSYNEFDWLASRQLPLSECERASIEEFVADVLQLSDSDHRRAWGDASPPGRYAATVVSVASEIEHRYSHPAAELEIAQIGVKVFKQTADALHEVRRVIPFHQEALARLPGMPNPHVQRILHAGFYLDSRGASRASIVQEWLEGETLEQLHQGRWSQSPVAAAEIRSILQQLLGNIVIPLWSRGLIWWDFRDANFCYDEQTDRLTAIDVDSLGAYASEILETPEIWTRRDKGRLTALARLRQMCARLVKTGCRPGKRNRESQLTAAWRQTLEPILLSLGKSAESGDIAERALQTWLNQLASSGLIA